MMTTRSLFAGVFFLLCFHSSHVWITHALLPNAIGPRRPSHLSAATTLPNGFAPGTFPNPDDVRRMEQNSKSFVNDWSNPLSLFQSLWTPPPQPSTTFFWDSILPQEWREFLDSYRKSRASNPTTTTTTPLRTTSSVEKNDPTPLAEQGDWAAYASPRHHDAVYYVHRRTGASRWDPPTETTTFPMMIVSQRHGPQHVATRGNWCQYKTTRGAAKVFYYHRRTGKSQWETPRVFRTAPPPVRIEQPKRRRLQQQQNTERASTASRTSPQGDWSAHWDSSHHRVYYYHRRTGESVWEIPTHRPEHSESTAVPNAWWDEMANRFLPWTIRRPAAFVSAPAVEMPWKFPPLLFSTTSGPTSRTPEKVPDTAALSHQRLDWARRFSKLESQASGTSKAQRTQSASSPYLNFPWLDGFFWDQCSQVMEHLSVAAAAGFDRPTPSATPTRNALQTQPSFTSFPWATLFSTWAGNVVVRPESSSSRTKILLEDRKPVVVPKRGFPASRPAYASFSGR